MHSPIKVRKKPVEVEAMEFLGTTSELHGVYLWIESQVGSIDYYNSPKEPPKTGVTIRPGDGAMIIRTLEGDMEVSLGDWVIRGVKGEFYPCKPDIFDETYELL